VPFYLRPSAPTAPDALICGDPARALAIAQHVLAKPRMSNHNRGLWGYHGETAAGRPLTVQATGIGAPSAVAVLAEAIGLGVERVIRIGTCAALGGSAALGSATVVTAARAGDGTSRALGAAGDVLPDEELTARLAAAAGVGESTVRSADLIPARDGLGPAGEDQVRLHDLQTAAVLGLGRRLGVPAAAALVVRSLDGSPLEDEPLDAALLRLAGAATAALDQAQPAVEG
jgi:uridine phosphorylase